MQNRPGERTRDGLLDYESKWARSHPAGRLWILRLTHRIEGWPMRCEDGQRNERNERPKNKGATDCSVAPRLVPSPRYFAKFRLLQLWPCRADASRKGRLRSSVPGGVEVDHAIFVGAEAADTSLVESSGRAADGVAQERRGSRSAADSEVVSA